MTKITRKGFAILWQNKNGEAWFFENETEAKAGIDGKFEVVPCELTYELNE